MKDEEITTLFEDVMCFFSQNNELYAYLKENQDCNSSNEPFVLNFRNAYKFYKDISINAGIDTLKTGNTYGKVYATSNGDAQDWMFAARGIYALNAELGTSNPLTDTFFI